MSYRMKGLNSTIAQVSDIADLINELQGLETEKEVAQLAVDYIPQKLGLLGASLYLVEGDHLRTTAFTQTWYTSALLKILPLKYWEYSVSLSKDKQNFIVRSISENKAVSGTQLADFVYPSITAQVANLLQGTAHAKSMISVPIQVNRAVIGAVLYGEDEPTEFEAEIPLLMAFANAIGTVIQDKRGRQG